MLLRKVFRDMKENKGAYIACIVVIAIGLIMFTSFSIVVDNLTLSKNDFYASQNFAEGFAEVRAMPLREVEKLRNIQGIRDIQGRLVEDVRVLPPGGEKDVYLRLVSVDTQKDNPINGVHLTDGGSLEENTMQIWLDTMFFDANQIELNQEIEIIAQGKKQNLRVVGAGQSPEFIYALRTSADIYPDPVKFGIAYIPSQTLQNIFSNQNTVNSIVFTLEPGASYASVERELKPKLKQYGLENLYPRKDQTSHMLLEGEIDGLETMAQSVPILFLGVAAAILYIMLRRMVEQQRGQIGILKAFGYTNYEILTHYMSYSTITGFIGGLAGGIGGVALAYPFTALLRVFFNMPGLQSSLSLGYFFQGILLSLVFSAFAGYRGCNKSLALQPAEAMRPPAPTAATKVPLERITILWNTLTVQGRMAVRNIFRSPGRTLFIFFGIMFAFALGGMTWAFKDITDQMLYDQYEKVETYDARISMAVPVDAEKALRELSGFPEARRTEALAEIPVTLINNWQEKNVVLLGIPKNSQLYHILDQDYASVPPPEEGILLSERLAKVLKVQPGNTIYVESPMMNNPEEAKTVKVTGIIPQHIGLNGYMELNSAQNFIGSGKFATAIMMSIDSEHIPALQEAYNSSATVAGVTSSQDLLAKTQEMMATYGSAIFVMALFAVLIGFAVIYNSSIITLSERSRELASMMVLGMTPKEVLSVITFEQWFIGVFAMLAGIPVTKLLLLAMADAFNNDFYTMPTTFSPFAIAVAFLITVVSMVIAQRMAGRKIKKLSLVEVLKSQE